jgi:hypothetical protein
LLKAGRAVPARNRSTSAIARLALGPLHTDRGDFHAATLPAQCRYQLS